MFCQNVLSDHINNIVTWVCCYISVILMSHFSVIQQKIKIQNHNNPAMNSNGFVDLNIMSSSNDSFPSIENWTKNRYSTVAYNYFIDLTELSEQRKTKKGDKNDFQLPKPKEVKLNSKINQKVSVLNRLTIKVSDVSQFPKVFQGKASVLKSYDIIAVMPTEQSSLQQACSMNDVDLICIDCQTKPTWMLTNKIYKTAVEQSKYFEICYGPALRDSSTLRNTIYLSHILYSVGKSKNLIFSSGISDDFYLRSPYEVIFLSYLFGFGENKARLAITSSPHGLLSRAVKRRQGKSCISVTPSSS